jgi:hypothetical protein
MHQRGADAKRKQERADPLQVPEPPRGHHAHFQQEQREHALKGRDEEAFHRGHAALSAQRADDERANEQQHTASKHRLT